MLSKATIKDFACTNDNHENGTQRIWTLYQP